VIHDQTTNPTPGGRPPAEPAAHAPVDWPRERWVALGDRLLGAVRPFASPQHALITPPGPEGGYGHAVDGLEGFARTFLIAGFRLAGERGAGLEDLAEWYARGLAAGVDPASPERWVRLDEHAQAKVEAASIALVLDMTRPWLWDRLSARTQEQVVDYLSPAVGDDTYPRINWVWFRLVVQTFLRSVGGPFSLDEMAEDVATHDGFERADGWMADGAERSFDHYVGWALQLYPTLWARMSGAQDLACARRDRDVAVLDRYLQDAVALVGADGSPLLQGRSLVYRFAAAAPFWVGALAQVPSVSAGRLRHAATAVVRHFVDRGAPDERGLLTLGWYGPWPRLAQSYSGPGSPYWAAKGLLGLVLPADHPVWTSPAEPLPVEVGDTVRAVRAPGWVVSGTRADGIVRVINHGTDHAVEGRAAGDSPLYARLGYSTASAPLLDEESWRAPLDQSVVLVDDAGRATHRAGMRTLTARVQDDADGRLAVAGSVAHAHWLTPATQQQHHGSGYVGTAEQAGTLTVLSLVRGPWELRLVRVDALTPRAPAATLHLRVGGWALAGPDVTQVPTTDGAAVAGAKAWSSIRTVTGQAHAGVTRRTGASPLGEPALVPWLVFPVQVDAWVAALVELSGGDRAPVSEGSCTAVLGTAQHGETVSVTWPDGVRTSTRLEPGPKHNGDTVPVTR